MCKKGNNTDDDNKKYHKVRDHCHYIERYRGAAYNISNLRYKLSKETAAAHNICNVRYKTLKEIPVVFHNGSTYGFHFIIKELAEEFAGQFKCLGENTGKMYNFFSANWKRTW